MTSHFREVISLADNYTEERNTVIPNMKGEESRLRNCSIRVIERMKAVKSMKMTL